MSGPAISPSPTTLAVRRARRAAAAVVLAGHIAALRRARAAEMNVGTSGFVVAQDRLIEARLTAASRAVAADFRDAAIQVNGGSAAEALDLLERARRRADEVIGLLHGGPELTAELRELAEVLSPTSPPATAAPARGRGRSRRKG